jgi:hypothetical protein
MNADTQTLAALFYARIEDAKTARMLLRLDQIIDDLAEPPRIICRPHVRDRADINSP